MSDLPLPASPSQSYHPSSESPKLKQGTQPQGLIITENPELLKLLKENSDSSSPDLQKEKALDKTGSSDLKDTNTRPESIQNRSSALEPNPSSIRSPIPITSSTSIAAPIPSNLRSPVPITSNTSITAPIPSNPRSPVPITSNTSITAPIPSSSRPHDHIPRSTTSNSPILPRRNTSSVHSFINPVLLDASGLKPLEDQYHFPRYVSLKSATQPFLSADKKSGSSESVTSPSPPQTDRSENKTVNPVSTKSDPFITEAEYPSFEKDRGDSGSVAQIKDDSPADVKQNTETGKQFFLVPVTSESPKKVSFISSDNKQVDVEDTSTRCDMESSKPKRIYVDAPDHDEDDDIRFVSSRIDDYDDKLDTYRQLDEAVTGQPESQSRTRSGKHVRYEDSDRYEDRSEFTRAPAPVQGFPLPLGPKLDSADELDLSREEAYQNSLKERVQENEKQVAQIEVPKLPISGGNEELVLQDSLDTNEDGYQQTRTSMARDSLELYNGFSARDSERFRAVENAAWSNPPPQPFNESEQEPSYATYREYGHEDRYMQDSDQAYPAAVPHGYYGDSWQQTAYVQRGDQLERYDVTVEQQYISHQVPITAVNYGHAYVHPDAPQAEHSYTKERYGEENPDSQYYSSDANPEREDGTTDTQESQKHSSIPQKPQYDYVANNKFDYGRAPRRTYRQIQEIKNDEKAKLETVFVKPKLKKSTASKLPVSNTRSQHNEAFKEPNTEPHTQRSPTNKAASAENLWDNRSMYLAEQKNGKVKPKKKLQKYPSEGGLNRVPQYSNPLPHARRAEMGKYAASAIPVRSSPPHHSTVTMTGPLSPGRQPLQLKPISQEILTDDGQKIIVDVNLRLSPTAGQPGEFIQFGQMSAPGPYGITEMENPARQQYMPRQIGNNQFNPYMGYPSQGDISQNVDSKENRDTMSPYSKIPPIPKSGHSDMSQFETNMDGLAWRETESDSEGYAAQFKKSKMRKEKPWYTIYKLEDYRRMQKEVRLGTLGPDLDTETYRERMEKKNRQDDYARQVKVRNQKELAIRKPPPFPRPKETDDIMNKRKVAVEYAKNVPKPTVKPHATRYNSYELASRISPSHVSPSHVSTSHMSPSPRGQPVKETLDLINLDKLQQRHERDKQNVALIRQTMGSERTVSQNA